MKLFLKIIFVFVQINLLAQTSVLIDINNFHLPFDNHGAVGRLNNMTDSYMGKSILFGGGIIVSGYADSLLWVSATEPFYINRDFLPGLIGSNSNDSNNVIYSVKATDPHFGKSWQKWKHAVEQGAYYYDGNKNGYYDPIDYNGNGIWEPTEDMPDILYDVTFFTVYNDGVPSENRRWKDSFPVGVEVRQTVFASSRNYHLDDVIFIRYSLLYKGLGNFSDPDTLSNVIFSISNDPDIGMWWDDMMACDTSLNSSYAYNDGNDQFFGNNSPALFRVIVQGPLVKSENESNNGFNKKGPLLGEDIVGGHENLGLTAYMGRLNADPYVPNPFKISIVRNYLEGKYFDGNLVDPCTFLYGEVFGEDSCELIDPLRWFSGDPVTNKGWVFTLPGSIYDITSTGKFDLIKNKPIDIIMAYVVGQGSDPLSSISMARENVRYVISEYNNNFPSSFEFPNYEEIYPKEFTLSQNYPNPFNPSTTIKFTVPLDVKRETSNTKLVVYDILGREVKTLVNENRAPGSYEITFDASQLASGVYFYRLQSGSFNQTKKMILLR